MHNERIVIGGLPIEIIRKDNLKNLYIRINPPTGDVTVSTPAGIKSEDIELFVLKKMPEITKVRDKMLALGTSKQKRICFWRIPLFMGKPYRLQVVYEGTHRKIVKTPTKIIMTVPEERTLRREKICSSRWYRKELKRVLRLL